MQIPLLTNLMTLEKLNSLFLYNNLCKPYFSHLKFMTFSSELWEGLHRHMRCLLQNLLNGGVLSKWKPSFSHSVQP